LSKRNAIIRNLPAVETLGSTEIIASDKTGTLTMNQMTVEKLYYHGETVPASAPIDTNNNALRIMNFANDTKIDPTGKLLGDPTETALVQCGLDHQFDVREWHQTQPRIAELPFDSVRKLMTTIHQLPDGQFFVAVKGAPDQLLKRIDRIEKKDGVYPTTDTDTQAILATNQALAQQALRVLMMAYKIIPSMSTVNSESLESNLVFAGMVGMIDPERPEAAEAVRVAKQAGIRPIMITGDHHDTAQAIAKRLGIIDANDTDDHVLTGAELNEHKVRIVSAWQKDGKVVAMTGDGVNDAPSLKQADIGIGMGITGTEVSKVLRIWCLPMIILRRLSKQSKKDTKYFPISKKPFNTFYQRIWLRC
jgi:Ca2+-transporting ATPase